MISPLKQNFIYLSFFCGLALSLLLLAITNSLRPLDNMYLTLSAQALAIISVSLVSGQLLKNKLSHSFLVSIIALFYTYAVALAFTATQYLHYGLYVLLFAFAAVGLFYLSNKFINNLHLGRLTKLMIAILGFIILFVVCSRLGLYIVQTAVPS